MRSDTALSACLGASGYDLTVAHSRGFEAGIWVELSNEILDLLGQPGMIMKVAKVEGDTLTLDPSTVPAAGVGWNGQLIHPKVRCGIKEGVWLDVEDGIQIKFGSGGEYPTGDYWLIPARVAIGGIEWSATDGTAAAMPAQGKTQAVNVALAILFTVVVNSASILIVKNLSNDSALRATIVALIQEMIKEAPATAEGSPPRPEAKASIDELEKRIAKLSRLGVPVGWTDSSRDASRRWPGWMPLEMDAKTWGITWSETIRDHFLGWLLTALAVSLGAPFWFDILNKVVTIRSAGKVPEEKTKPSGKGSGGDFVTSR